MPHLSAGFTINPDNAVSVITGQTTEHGSVVSDGNGEALYAVYNTSTENFECRVTTAGARSIARTADSTTLRSTIVTGKWNRARNVGLNVIDGTLYAVVVGCRPGSDEAGTFIYECTDRDGDGTWSRIASIGTATPSSAAGGPDVSTSTIAGTGSNDARWAGEIATIGSTFVLMAHVFSVANVGGTQTLIHQPRLFSSTNLTTWTQRVAPALDLGELFSGATNSFGQFDSDWYSAIQIDGDAGTKDYYSANGTSWTLWGSGTSGNLQKIPCLSSRTAIYRWTDNIRLEVSTGSPRTTAWTEVLNGLTYGLTNQGACRPHVCNAGPDGSPFIVATHFGVVMPLALPARRPTVGRIGFG